MTKLHINTFARKISRKENDNNERKEEKKKVNRSFLTQTEKKKKKRRIKKRILLYIFYCTNYITGQQKRKENQLRDKLISACEKKNHLKKEKKNMFIHRTISFRVVKSLHIKRKKKYVKKREKIKFLREHKQSFISML